MKKAVILAGGLGTRLKPYTITLPKPLVPIGDRAILDVVLYQLAANGFLEVTIAIGHLGELIRAYVGDGSRWGLSVNYHFEDKPLSTIGPLVEMKCQLPEHFLVMNGDVLTDMSYRELFEAHLVSGAAITVSTYERDVKIDFGVLEFSNSKNIIKFSEKPTLHYSVSMGVYVLSRRVLDGYEPGRALGFDQLMLDLIAEREYPHAFPFGGYWLDVGRPEDFEQANNDFPSLRDSGVFGPALQKK